MKTLRLASSVLGAGLLLASALAPARAQTLRPPSVPLVSHDPYFSIWSASDKLNDDDTRHWTGRTHSLTGLLRIDGKPFRLMGKDAVVPVLEQKSVEVLPTRTIYTFAGAGVKAILTFTSPLLPDDLDVLSRPVTYVSCDVVSTDGAAHAVSLYFDAGAELSVNVPEQKVRGSRVALPGLTALRIGSVDQPVLQKRGDDLRIDWGYLYLGTSEPGAKSAIADRPALLGAFTQNGGLPAKDDAAAPRAAQENALASALVLDYGKVGTKSVSRRLLLAYDDEYSILFFRKKLRPYWRRGGVTGEQMVQAADRDYAKVMARCRAFDAELMADLTRVGGKEYAQIAALAYRQSLAAQKLVADANGQPLMFSKENFSNGCIATVDILYPESPLLLLLSPTLVKASLVPLLEYSVSPRWKWPFAPHDMGTYPVANGQVYGGGERTEENQMPVEESGNMMLVIAALAKSEGNADFVSPYWAKLTQWAEYLVDKGFDPESQLSTDDFAGHLAHNVNLSAKAIEAIGAYAYLSDLRGDKAGAAKYRKKAEEFAARWIKEGDNGAYSRLAFDRPDTWSQKYNLAWDRILGLNLFPTSVMRKEMAYYRTRLNPYGLPLDNRDNYTKLDWTIWTATLTGDRNDFVSLVKPVYDFLNATPDRVPMSDWYRTTQPQKVGFQARSVVGGVFIPLLGDAATWNKWVKRDKNTARHWAAIPAPPVVTAVVPTAQKSGIVWQYTTQKPGAEWFTIGFSASNWKTGEAGFGTAGTPGAVVRTNWNTPDIWIRRDFVMPAGTFPGLQFALHHDEDAEIYINGVLAARVGGFTADYDLTPLTPAGRAALKPGKNSIAVHCHQTGGGQYIDVGLSTVTEP